MQTASFIHVDDAPEVRAALAECDAISARRVELQSEVVRLRQLVRVLERDLGVQEDPTERLERILRGEGLTAKTIQKADVSARLAEVARDLRVLETFHAKAINRVAVVRRELTAARVRQKDFFAAAQAISLAVDQLERANAAMRDLCASVRASEGHADLSLLSSTYMGLTFHTSSVDGWRTNVAGILGAPLTVVADGLADLAV